MWTIQSSVTWLSSTSFFRIRRSEDGDDPCGVQKSSNEPTTFTPIFVKILCKDIPQDALIDTGSAITIIHKCLLNKIPHKKFIRKEKNHLSANCSTLNIIGEILLEINVNGIKTKVIADVTTNLVTNLILGSDWIQRNNVYILTPEKRIMIRSQGREVSIPFVKPPLLNYPVTLTNHITIPPFSEQLIEAQVQLDDMEEVLFELNLRLKNKALFIANTLLDIQNGKIRISIINATNRQQTLSEGTKLGVATQILSSTSVTISSNNLKERIPKGKACKELIPQGKVANMNTESQSMSTQASTPHGEQYICRECQQYFTTGNGLFKHLRDKCYPEGIREQINKLIKHINDKKQREQILKILWKYGKLFDIREPSKIDMVLKNAIDTGTHRPIHTPPYRKSNKDQEILGKETDKLLKNGIIEHSISPWSSPVVLVEKKDGTTRFCVHYRRLNQITTKDAFPLPRIDDIYDQLTKATYFTKFDFQIRLFSSAIGQNRPTKNGIFNQRWAFSISRYYRKDLQMDHQHFSVLLRPPPPSKKSILVRKIKIEINAWEDSPKFTLSEAL